MFFEQGLGGLSAAEQKLNIIGKNIANGNTNGYKTSSIDFTNVLADTLNTPNTGASITAASGPLSGKVTQSFTQGPISGTGNPLDIAINGKGFFQLTDLASGKLSYTRDGAFKLNGQNKIENASGLLLTGLQGGVPGPIDLTNYQTSGGATLDSFSIDSSGNINGVYTDASTKVLGTIQLANFAGPSGLSPYGNNSWVATTASGPAVLNAPSSTGLGSLQSAALEGSNEDQTSDMVALLGAQRAYQANAQTVKTQDQMAQALLNL
jgi:flagellar hook protein FlgE